MYNLSRLYYILILALAIFPSVIIIQDAYAQNCMELNTCDWSQFPFEMFLQPFLLNIGAWFYVIAWAIVVGLIYLRSTPINAGVSGLIIAATLTSSQFANEFVVFQEAIRLGIILFAIALSFMTWTMLKSRLQANN